MKKKIIFEEVYSNNLIEIELKNINIIYNKLFTKY